MAMFLCLYNPWNRYFALDGVLSFTDKSLPILKDESWSIFYWTRNFLPVQAIWWLGFLAAVGFTLGTMTRLSTILLLIVQSSMIQRNRWVANGEDLVFRMLLLYACFATLDNAYSLKRWLDLRRRSPSEPLPEPLTVSGWPIRLMQINIALIYVISLPNKLTDDVAWLNGHAIYLSIVSNLWSRFPWPALFYNGLLSTLFTYGTVLTEGLFPILIWFPKTRRYALAGIASLHLGIALILKNVTFFSLAMDCGFLVFLTADDFRDGSLIFKGRQLEKTTLKEKTIG
jgi:hypothetical protein